MFGKKEDRYGAWGAPIYAAVNLALACVLFQYRPALGAFFWLASIAAGAYAARLSSLREN